MGITPRGTGRKAQDSVRSKHAELLYYGLHICETLAAQRRQAIIRVYCTDEHLAYMGELLRWCAAQRKAYHLVTSQELEKITGSVHHEGVAILAAAPVHGTAQQLQTCLTQEARPLMFLDAVQNPHNIGSIMRVMAHFGWPYLLGKADLAPMSAAAARISEGGAEFVQTFALEDPLAFLMDLRRQGYRIVGTSSHAKRSLYQQSLAAKICFVMGHEVYGVSPEIEAIFDDIVMIPGTGQIESLNVAVASGLMLGEHARLHGVGRARGD